MERLTPQGELPDKPQGEPAAELKAPQRLPQGGGTKRARSGDTRYLEQRRQGWYVVLEVPPSLRERLGRKRLRKSLGTRSLTTAQAKRWAMIATLRADITGAQGQRAGDPIANEALGWREAMLTARQGDGKGHSEDDDSEAFIMGLISDRSEQIHAKDRAKGHLFDGLATGRATPLELHLETWLSEGGQHGQFQERTKGDHRRAVKELGEWLSKEYLGATLEAVDRRNAGRFMSEHLLRSGRANKTITKAISSLSSYWTWLRKRGHLPDDQRIPWADQAPAKKAAQSVVDGPERAFTDAEVVTLLAGQPGSILADFMRMAALTGMRREEIGRLTIGDCGGGIFVVQRGKTEAARRRVPIHSTLSEIVARRSKGKAATDFLFHDLTSRRAERTDAIGKHFQRYREGLGVMEGTGRRSLVNFHSLRRWFVTKAVNAGRPPHMVSLVVGHTEGRKGMTLGRYWSGADDEALRAVVEAVKLPDRNQGAADCV